MKTHLLYLLPLILLSSSGEPGAQALRCHECNGERNCYRPVSCNNMTRYCLTSWYTPPGQQMTVTKTCAFTCPDVHLRQTNSKDSCCNADLCNSALFLHASWVMLTLSICFIYLS